MSETAKRFNTGKPELSYILDIPRALEALARVFEMGATKYGRRNWQLGGKPDQEYLDAAIRHILAHVNEGTYDEEGGTLHLAHAIWNLAVLIELNLDAPVLNPNHQERNK